MKLTMQLGVRSYDIIIKRGSLGRMNQLVHLDRKVLVVTDSGVPVQYVQQAAAQCAHPYIVTVPQGEDSKSLKVWQQLLHTMLEKGFGRGDAVMAVGGGVVGDLAGFAAASYMRGIDFINLPTTTLAQIDSSIGGKTAINFENTKNIVGAFWQPRLVIVDPDVLSTLPPRHFAAGLAEAVKAGLLADSELFRLFEEEDYNERIEEVIYRSLIVKKNIVERDENEKGDRAALNLGHTIGHGIESVSSLHGYRALYHGECVALGMLPMIEDKKLATRLRKVYRRLGLPARVNYDRQAVVEAMRHDKKAQAGSITVVKIPQLAQFRLDKVPFEEVAALVLGTAREIQPRKKEQQE
ncbi:MAG TPA: 3-dehydroquinate synthase [Candidatus Anaerofilum excrementigallinarum]|nr:3-dehydroquinate synthase [Candidatus Anaerofilum excrementigallinarum]